MLKIKTFVKLDDGNMRTIDTIQHEGGLWLLYPYGLQPPTRKCTSQRGMIRIIH